MSWTYDEFEVLCEYETHNCKDTLEGIVGIVDSNLTSANAHKHPQREITEQEVEVTHAANKSGLSR